MNHAGSIICADSKTATLTAYVEILERLDYDVRTCLSAADLHRLYDALPPDLVIMSTALCDASAGATCRRIRQRSTDNGAAIMIVCGTDDREPILTALAEGANEFLVEPFREFEFQTKVAMAISRRRTEAAPLVVPSRGDLYAGVYQIIDEIGRGAHSVVYRAGDTSQSDAVEVALKVFDIEAYEYVSASFNSIFLREAYSMSKLEHRNLVRMLDFGKYSKTYFIVMEFVYGKTLEDIVQASGPMDEENLTLLACQVVSALEYLQAHKVVHRDIKPGNILITVEGDIKLADFGLAKQQDDVTLTARNRKFMGTPAFVAPEQILGERDLDGRCDVYSLGATLFYCGTNMVPFTGNSVMAVLSSNLNDDPPLICDVNPAVGRDFSEIVANMMSKDRDERWIASEVKRRLTALLEIR